MAEVQSQTEGEQIDIPRFRADAGYRRQVLAAAQAEIDAERAARGLPPMRREPPKKPIEFPTPEYVHEADRYIFSRVNMSFAQTSRKWSFTDRHELKLALEKVPQRSTGSGDDWEAPETGIALDLTFKHFALERGLLPPSYFEEPGHEALTVEEVIAVGREAAAKYRPSKPSPLWRRALQRLALH